jgi:hypothetical protein
VAAQVREAVGDLELWFDSIMDRVSQRYASRVRVFTVVFAVLLAFTLHLDASVLLHQIRNDPDLRAGLTASAEAMSKQADLVLGTSVTSVYRIAAQRLQSSTPELKEAGEPPTFVSEADGAAWVARHTETLDEKRRAEVSEGYRNLVQEELNTLTGRLRDEASAIRNKLEGTGLKLIPNYSEHTRESDRWPDWWLFTEPDEAGRTLWNQHFFGVLASAALLSLGAPFWFHALETATTLRPIVATKEKEDRAQRT